MRSAIRYLVAAAALLAVLNVPSLSAAPGASTVKVMTQNMDAGTDFGLALAFVFSETPTVGIDLTYQELQQGHFAERAAILAGQIAASQPDLVSLQEVTNWHVIPTDETVDVDQLGLLLQALTDLGQHYSVVGDHLLTNLGAPMSDGRVLTYLDSDVVLKRDDAGLTITNPREGLFTHNLVIPGTPLGDLEFDQGWIALDVTRSGNTFTLVDTHLITTVPGLDLTDLQASQALDIAGLFGGLSDVVVAGDFNSNATHTPPEHTLSVQIMAQAGFTDTWPVANPGQPGFTWPLYVEDPLAVHPNGPFERIDFIFERGLGIEAVRRIGWTGAHASDHAGVIATLSF